MSKKPPKGELSVLAREVLESLEGTGRTLLEVADQIAAEPAANRRDFFDALRTKAGEKKRQRDPAGVFGLLSPSINPGSNNKPDFALKYWKSLFGCAKALCMWPTDVINKRLFMCLLELGESETTKIKNSSPVPFDSLSSVDGVVSGFDCALSDESLKAELTKTRATWLSLVPELAASSTSKLSPSGARGLLSILESNPNDLPAAVRLSIEPLARMADLGVPSAGTLGESSPLSGIAPVQSKGPRSTDAEAPTESRLLPEAARFSADVVVLLNGLSTSIEGRLSNQSKIIEKLESERADLLEQVQSQRQEAATLVSDRSQLKERIRAIQDKLDETLGNLSSVQNELSKYRARHNAIVESADARELEAVARTKRELVEKELHSLISVRDCLAELNRSSATERAAKQAATNFNNFVRFLRHGKYISSEQIAKIEIHGLNIETP